MPQLDVTAFLVQYIWGILGLGFLFFLLVFRVLPVLQRASIVREWLKQRKVRGTKLSEQEKLAERLRVDKKISFLISVRLM